MKPPPPPAEIQWLTDIVGIEAALALIEARCGTRLYIPKMFDPQGDLAKEFGPVAARALVRRWGGDTIKVPLLRWWRIRLYRSQDMSYAAIARRVGCSEDTVWRTLNAAGDVNGQMSLAID